MAFMGIIFIYLIFLIMYLLIVYIISAFGYATVLSRGFGEESWKGFVPFYNTFSLYKQLGFPILFLINLLVSVFTIAFVAEKNSWLSLFNTLYMCAVNVYVEYQLVKRFHKSMGLAVLAAFFPNVALLITGLTLPKEDPLVGEYREL